MWEPSKNAINISENDKLRSDFIKHLVQREEALCSHTQKPTNSIPRVIVQFWDDEDEIQAVMQKVFNSFIQEAGTLKQVDRYLDVNRADESKKVSGQQLFNNWRRFLNQWS